MQKRWFLILNVLFLIIVVSFLIFFVWEFSLNDEVIINDECVDVHRVASFVYDSCYDNSSKKIFVEVKRGFDIYQLNKIKFNFFDFSNKSFEVMDVPLTNGTKSYTIYSERNPGNMNVFLDVIKDFSSPICGEPRKVFVRDCPFVSQNSGLDLNINPLTNETLPENFTTIGVPSDRGSDILAPNLVDRESVWKSVCESDWDCSSWGACVEGVERRKCEDKNGCYVPTGLPETARNCDGSCDENWQCVWSECRGGYTVPDCNDLNDCGTTYSLPQKLACSSERACTPGVSCGAWSECKVEYNFLDLASGDISELGGKKSRICEDKNGCTSVVEEERDCSVNVDIYTRTFTKCGVEYLGIYNRLNNKLIARIEKSSGQADPYLNIHLEDTSDSPYCDYCFDGVLDGDEEDVDCGGSCQICSERHAKVDYRRMGAFVRFLGWVKRLFT